MHLLPFLRKIIPLDYPLRIFYHKIRAVIAAVVYRFPGQKMIIIGVTGTDGKTTTCNMIAAILREAGYNVGLISTVLCRIGERSWMNETKMTSLDPFVMNRYLSMMREAKCQYVVLEVSSHAILYERIWGVNIDMAVMTHISSDHLDLHRTIQNYVHTKKRLFLALNKSERKPKIPKVIILNADDQYYQEFSEIVADKNFSYSCHEPSATLYASDIRSEQLKTLCTVHMANVQYPLTLTIPGTFNVYNALAAMAVAVSQNIYLTTAIKALSALSSIPGRMERIDEGQPFSVIVDYAHTEGSLEKVLSTLRPTVRGRLIHVFGATGDRDKTKRPKMGLLSHQYADHIIVTNDDTYTESEMSIIADIVKGIPREEYEGLWVIPNREIAIKTAIMIAEKDDLILITGKGAEQVLVTNQGKTPWDDRKLASNYLKGRYS